MILGKPAQLRSAAAVSVVNVAGTTLPVSSQLKSLGVIIDSHIRFVSHVAVIRMCNCHTRALRHVCEHLTTKTVQTIDCSVIMSRIDYCNSLLYGAPVAVVEKLQSSEPGSSVSSADVSTLDRYYSLSTGRLSNSASNTK